ncbi:MAG: membrane dipeptidase [Candidatus Fermentibacteraceae bacterium]
MIFDAHCDTMVRTESPDAFVSGGGKCHVDLPGLREAEVAHLVTALCIEPYPDRLTEVWEHGARNFRECSVLSGEVKLHFALEGCMPLYLDMEMPGQPLVASLTWNGDNPYGSGIGGTGGLTSMGVTLARKLNAQGTRLDASHLNDRSRHDLLSMGIPVCATHCNSRKLCDFPRNLPDTDLKEIAARGGVVGVTLVPDFLRPKGEDPSVSDVVRHIEYIAETAGIDSVGLGSDFDGISVLPRGIRGVRDINLVFSELSEIGWGDTDIDKVRSGNWMRFFSL